MRFVTVVLVGSALVILTGAAPAAYRPTGVIRDCADQSLARFPGAFTSRRNVVVGPLAMIGAGRFTPPTVVREFGGNKFPVVVAARHRVTIQLTRRARRFASLGYDDFPDGPVTFADGHRVVTFKSCSAARAGSEADGKPVTFWSGFVLASRPHCVDLLVWVDQEARPRRARIALGRRC